MLDLNDPRWASLTGGYKRPYDPRPALQALRADPAGKAPWEELWQELHHQGDVGEASYASVPVLADVFTGIPRNWQFYALLACIELERRRKANPTIPAWIQPSYDHAWSLARRYAVADLETSADPLLIRTALAVAAFAAGQVKLGALLTDLDESELDELLEDHLGWSTLYHVAG